jgi:hypothetical protein
MRNLGSMGYLSSCVSGALVASAAIKFIHGCPHGAKGGPALFWCATAAEIAISIMLWTGLVTSGCPLGR